MANCRFLYRNLVHGSGVTLAASSTSSTGGYGISNLLNTKRGLPWRSAVGVGNQTITISFASAKLIKAIALVNYRAHTGGSIKAETKNGGGAYGNFAAGTFTIPASNRTRLVVLFDTTGVTATDVRITFQNTAAANEDVELGVAFVVDSGGYFSPIGRLANDNGYRPIDPSQTSYAEGGQRQSWLRQHYLEFEGTFPVLLPDDVTTLLQLRDLVGAATPIIFALNPSDVDTIAYGYLPRILPLGGLNGGQRSVQFTFEEAP